MHALILCAALAAQDAGAVTAPAEDPLPTWVIDAPVAGLMLPSTTGGIRGVLAPSLRLTWLGPSADGRARSGFEGAVFGAFEDDGTDRIRASSWMAGAEGAALTGWAFGSAKARFMPYLWASLLAAGGSSSRRVDETVETRAIFTAGGFAGAGTQIQVAWFSLRLDFGMGAVGAELAGRARAAVGGTF